MKTLEEIREYLTSEKVAEKSLVVIIQELVTEEVNTVLQEAADVAIVKQEIGHNRNGIFTRTVVDKESILSLRIKTTNQ